MITSTRLGILCLVASTLFGASARVEIVLLEPSDVTRTSIADAKREGFRGVALVLDDRAEKAALRETARAVETESLDLYWWIEVGRNPQMAAANPRWMAGLGSHADWQKRFPEFAEPGVDQVAKAYPWVPIVYAEAFAAHLARIEQLCKELPRARGLFLNDLQAGPGSCGCGNLQCRWAVDYHVPATTRKMTGTNIAGRFITEAARRVNTAIIPVWTTECEDADMPPEKNRGKPSTGLCGSVGCATGACPMEFSGQLSELLLTHNGPVAFLGVHTALERTSAELGGGPEWAGRALKYVHATLAAERGTTLAADRAWVVVDGLDKGSEKLARDAAAQAGAATVIVARTKIDQSYSPRILAR